MPFASSSYGSGGHVADDDADYASDCYGRITVFGNHCGVHAEVDAGDSGDDVRSEGEEATYTDLNGGREMNGDSEQGVGSSNNVNNNGACGSPLLHRADVGLRHEVSCNLRSLSCAV